MVVVVVCGGDVVVVVVDDVVEVVVDGWDGSNVVGGAFLGWDAMSMARRGGAVVGGMVTPFRPVFSPTLSSSLPRRMTGAARSLTDSLQRSPPQVTTIKTWKVSAHDPRLGRGVHLRVHFAVPRPMTTGCRLPSRSPARPPNRIDADGGLPCDPAAVLLRHPAARTRPPPACPRSPE